MDRIRMRWSFGDLPNLLKTGVAEDPGAPSSAFLEGLFASLAEGYQEWVRPVGARLQPARVRLVEPSDVDRCLEIQQACEGRFYPHGYRESFRDCLIGGKGLYLVVERHGVVAGCGGIEPVEHPNQAVFHFDMVHPDFHGQGLGTALLLARVAMLDLRRQPGLVLMNVPVDSLGFYRRFGFGAVHQFTDHLGNKFVYAGRHYKAEEVNSIRRTLRDHDVSWPDVNTHRLEAV